MYSPGAKAADNSVDEGLIHALKGRRERRRSVRHKVHTPAYASLRGASRGMLLDLSEVLDVSEDGMAIQTSSQLDRNRYVSVFLDLSETKSCIQASGRVVWSDQRGRAGISFRRMPAASQAQLNEWLFLNSLRAWDLANSKQEPRLNGSISPATDHTTGAALGDDSLPLLTLSALAAVKREIASSELDLRASLQLIAERAASFTNATGAAIALAQRDEMICRASVGSVAPPVGLRLRAGEGFSGECLRRGRLEYCEDSEIDPRVDRESCRLLGVRSMVAVPVHLGNVVGGLLEAFSSRPKAFTSNDHVVLRRLAQMIAMAVSGATAPVAANHPQPTPAPVKLEGKAPEPIADPVAYEVSPARSGKILFASVVVTLAVLVWVFAPQMDSWIAKSRHTVSAATWGAETPVTNQPAATAAQPVDLEAMRQLAEQGDPTAQFDIGVHYALGDVKGYSEAVHWISRAAEQGHVLAQATLGTFYLEGRGVQKDPVKAYCWLWLARNSGDEASKYRIASLASRMSPAQILAAQQQANDWILSTRPAQTIPLRRNRQHSTPHIGGGV
jgi:putative methionine-R-sulfoxide reductase with GAF domain